MNKFLNMKIIETGVWMDGGTMTIKANLQTGESILIEFVQNMIIKMTFDNKFAGQLYLDDLHIEPRSVLEKQIVEALKEILYGKGGMPWMEKSILGEKLEYLESDQYLKDLEDMRNTGGKDFTK